MQFAIKKREELLKLIALMILNLSIISLSHQVNRSGYARRAGMRVTDRIVRINDTYADCLTLREAQLLIRRSGKSVRIYVTG